MRYLLSTVAGGSTGVLAAELSQHVSVAAAVAAAVAVGCTYFRALL